MNRLIVTVKILYELYVKYLMISGAVRRNTKILRKKDLEYLWNHIEGKK